MGYINNSRKWDKCAVLLNTAHPTRRHTCLGVGVGVCVVMFTCYPALKSALPALGRVGRSSPPPHSSLGVLDFSQAKKNLIKRQGFFHKPNQVFRLAWLPILELTVLHWIFL